MIGFAAASDPTNEAAFSGVPAGLIGACDELGVPVRPLAAELPGPWQRPVEQLLTLGLTRPTQLAGTGSLADRLRRAARSNGPRVHAGATLATVRSGAIRARLRRAGDVTACIQFGSEYRLPPTLPYVTYDDATIVQLRREYAYPWMQLVPASELDQMIVRQRKILRGAQRCCVTNHWAAASVIEDYRVPAERIVVTGQGARAGSAAVEREWGSPRFLFVSMDWPRKNGDGVLAGFSRIREQRPDARLDLVGTHPDLDLPGVTSHGVLPLADAAARKRLGELFRAATCLLLPSWLEPSACVLAEALQAGLPAIASSAGGSATIVGDAGLIIDPSDASALPDAMLRMCEERTLRDFESAARHRAPLFTWTAVAGRVLRALQAPGIDVSEFALPL